MLRISQSQIHEYEECPRLYYLKHIKNLAWPREAEESDVIAKGNSFHTLVQQSLVGISEEYLLQTTVDEQVSEWFSNYCRIAPLHDFDDVIPEVSISYIHNDVLWNGKFDVLAIKDKRIMIFDWKTTKTRKKDSFYSSSPQTRLYRVLARDCASRFLNGVEASSEDIQMVYWFPQFPDNPAVLRYSEKQYQKDIEWLANIADKLQNTHEIFYPGVKEMKKCEKCMYCRYCKGSASDKG